MLQLPGDQKTNLTNKWQKSDVHAGFSDFKAQLPYVSKQDVFK